MPRMDQMFTPTRAAGLNRLDAFVPASGSTYAQTRNTDRGPGARGTTSQLSPYVRRRLVTEAEVADAACRRHGPEGAEKFIQEVFWRTYWKGWLELRPQVFERYCSEVAALTPQAGRAYQDAIAGQTGVGCFDAWARELTETGWLHNHARMWTASIWIFTLRLPWQLGADWFLTHLVDADPASNTLSWRWVAGLHTPGKHYLARAENIRRFTNGRFDPYGELNEDAAPLHEPEPALSPP